jgi:hypothetical protein
MSSRRHERRRGCTGKLRFESEPAALAKTHAEAERGGDPLGVYRCLYCGGWHTGHRPLKTGRLRRVDFKWVRAEHSPLPILRSLAQRPAPCFNPIRTRRE